MYKKYCTNMLACSLILGCFANILGAKLPSFVEKCSLSDPKLADCYADRFKNVLPNIKHGVKDLHIPDLSPFHLDEISIQSTGNLKLKVTDVNIFGLETATFSDFKIDKDVTSLKAHIDAAAILGTYDIDGKVLVLPIKGHGAANFTITNISFDISITTEIGPNDKGVDHLNIKELKVDYFPGRIYYQLDDLFNGDPRVGTEMNAFINENWEEFSKDIKPAVLKTVQAIIKTIFVNLAKMIPIIELYAP